MTHILRRADGTLVDARGILVRARREVTNLLNIQADMKRSINIDDGSCFIDIQHFYNAMTYAIHAFEDAYSTCSVSIRSCDLKGCKK